MKEGTLKILQFIIKYNKSNCVYLALLILLSAINISHLIEIKEFLRLN